MADPWEEAAQQFKSGGSPHMDAQKPDEDWKLWSPNLMPGAKGSDATNRFISGFAGAVNPIPGIAQMASEAVDPNVGLKKTIERHVFQPQADQLKQAGEAVRGQGEFEHMSPAGRASSAVGHGLAGALPLVGPAAAGAGEQIGSGDVAGGLGTGAGLIASVKASPPAARGVGKGLMRTAEPIAESALGIRNVDRAPGVPNKKPGRAALDLTKGIRPGTVAESAQGVISDLVKKRDAIIAASMAQANLDPAIMEIDAAIAKARAGNSDAAHLEPMRRQLTEARPGFQGATTPQPKGPAAVSNIQSPEDLLRIRQRFGEDFTKFDTARPLSSEVMRVGNRAYGKLTNELHSAVPESAPMDKTISNLIPVKEGSHAKDLNAGVGQRMLGRLAAHTGALTGGALGYHEFGLPGAVAGVAIPEILSSPAAQMAAARGLNAIGQGMRSPYFTGPLQAGPFIPQITPQSLVEDQPPQFARGGVVGAPKQVTPKMLAGRRSSAFGF